MSPKPPLPSVHTDQYRSTHLQDVPKATLTQCTHRPVQVYPPSGCPQSHPYPVYTQTSTGLPTFRISPKPPLPSVQTHRPVQVYPPSGHPQSHPYPVYRHTDQYRSTHLQDIPKATLTQCTDTQTSTGLPTFRTSPKPPLPSVHTDLYRSTHFQHITKATLAQCAYRPVQVYPLSAHHQSHPCPVCIQTSTGLPTFRTSPKLPLPSVYTHRPVQVYPPSAHSQSHPCPACIQTSTGLPTFRTSPKPPLPSVHTTWNSWVSRDLPFLSMDVLYSIRSLSSSLPTSLLWSPGHRQQRKA